MSESKREIYAMEFNGDCLGELVPAGTVLVAFPGEEISQGDLVLLAFDLSKPGPWAEFGRSIGADGHSGIGKIFLSAYEHGGETYGMFGQLKPPGVLPIPMSALRSVDKVEFYGEPTGHDREAMAMLLPFMMSNVQQKEAA